MKLLTKDYKVKRAVPKLPAQASPATRHTLVEVPPPEAAIGERLFEETRFAKFFASHATDMNAGLGAGDPVVATTQTIGSPLRGPFVGLSMNCRA